MEVQVAQGSWRHGAILSVRVGEMRRQAALQFDTCLNFETRPSDVQEMQVDVFARVGSSRISLEPSQEVYALNLDSDGFSDLSLRIRPQEINDGPELDPLPVERCESSKSSASSVDTVALTRLRKRVSEYLKRFGLRELLQELFRTVIKEMPDDPVSFMLSMLQRHLDEMACKNGSEAQDYCRSCESPTVSTNQQQSLDDRIIRSPTPETSCSQQQQSWSELQQQYEERIESQQSQILLLENRLQDFEVLANASAARDAETAAWQAERKQMHAQQLEAERSWQARSDALQQQVSYLGERLRAIDAKVISAEMSTQTELGLMNPGKYAQDREGQWDMLRSASSSPTMPAGDLRQVQHGRATPADEAAGGAEVSPVSTRSAPQGWVSNDKAALSTGFVGPQSVGIAGTSAAVPANISEVNTHMLSKLMASTYAPPISPTLHYEPREDQDDDLGQLAMTQNHPELLVEVVDCKDKATNGTFACVGSCNGRPLYRLLGLQARYLYYSQEDPAWCGWWISDKTGSENYVEWFSDPAEARLPVYCRKGELGSRVVEAPLSREIIKKIGEISSQAEKTTIRGMLTEAFGARFIKLDGSQVGLMSKTSPVVAVAHAMEAQQRAIQLLHSQLAAETQRREAAEVHAQTMEESFEMLQLRIQAKMPGAPCLTTSAKPMISPLSPVSTDAPQSVADIESLSQSFSQSP